MTAQGQKVVVLGLWPQKNGFNLGFDAGGEAILASNKGAYKAT